MLVLCRFTVEHLVIDGFRLDRIKSGPKLSEPRNLSTTLRYPPTYTYEGACGIIPTWLDLGPSEPSSLFLEIGSKNAKEKTDYPPSGKVARHIVEAIILEYGSSRHDLYRIITISPYLGEDGSEHSCCFGRVPPKGYPSFPMLTKIEIKFWSDCRCGNGDVTKCKQDSSRCLYQFFIADLAFFLD